MAAPSGTTLPRLVVDDRKEERPLLELVPAESPGGGAMSGAGYTAAEEVFFCFNDEPRVVTAFPRSAGRGDRERVDAEGVVKRCIVRKKFD